MTAAITCAYHADRRAAGYCGRCGKAVCRACLVRLSTGNYCVRCTEEAGPSRPGQAGAHGRGKDPRALWWIALAVLLGLVALRLVVR